MDGQDNQPQPPDFDGQEVHDLLEACDRRLVELRMYRSSYATTWRELSDYLYPTRGRFEAPPMPNKGNKGQVRNQSVVDRTGTKAIKRLASFLLAGICSPARQWFRMTIADPKLAEDPAVKAWLSEAVKRMLTVFAESNTYQVLAGLFEELPTFGTGCVLVLQDYHDVIRLYLLTAGEYLLACDERYKVDTVYREYCLTVAQAAKEFGENNLSDAARSLLKGGQLGREINIVHAIEPNGQHEEGRIGWRGMPFVSTHYEYGQGRERALRVKGFKEFPGLAPRWDTVSTDVYGHGPGEDALPDVKALQLMKRREAEAVDKAVKPPLIADPSLQNASVSLLPGAINFVSLQNGGGMKPIYEVRPDIQGLRECIEDLRKQIREGFFDDLITLFSSGDGPQMTAEEVRAKKQEKLLLLGPMLERFHDEALSPLITLTFNTMWHGGLLPPPPPHMHGAFVKTEYISLLAQEQRAVGTTAIEGILRFVGSLQSVDPDAMDNIDVDEAIQIYADLLGVEPKILRDQDTVAAMRKGKQAQQQAAQAQQQSMAAVQGAQQLSQTELGGGQNALQRILGG